MAPDVTRYPHPVLPARKLGRGPVRVELAGQAYALFRDGAGRPAALADACPHRGAPLSIGRVRPDGRLQCAYHGWHFAADGQGVCPSQPGLGRCDARAMQAVEHRGYVWLAAPGVAREALPALDYEAEGFEPAGAFGERAEAPLHVVLDNFSEDEHTPFVHGRLGWTERDAGEIDFDADVFDDRTEVHYRGPQRPSWLARLLLLRPGDTFHNDWVTRFDPVHAVYSMFWTDPRTGDVRPVMTRAAVFFVPETDRSTFIHTFVFVKVRDERYRRLAPLVRAAAVALGWKEVRDDARFVPHLAHTPFELKGMRLDRYDKPIVHNHRLLERIYYGRAEGDAAGEGRSTPLER